MKTHAQTEEEWETHTRINDCVYVYALLCHSLSHPFIESAKQKEKNKTKKLISFFVVTQHFPQHLHDDGITGKCVRSSSRDGKYIVCFFDTSNDILARLFWFVSVLNYQRNHNSCNVVIELPKNALVRLFWSAVGIWTVRQKSITPQNIVIVWYNWF